MNGGCALRHEDSPLEEHGRSRHGAGGAVRRVRGILAGSTWHDKRNICRLCMSGTHPLGTAMGIRASPCEVNGRYAFDRSSSSRCGALMRGRHAMRSENSFVRSIDSQKNCNPAARQCRRVIVPGRVRPRRAFCPSPHRFSLVRNRLQT
ncbi:fatty acid desaturase [Burkholderia sp. AU27893]|uniref:Fatty acid desaturase n=1 Tax=Burkholderia contaminans TaxID=488447 RepID=A0A2S5DQX2_9BURK|nr:fatty acid desaturase [Burkholderia sp. AU27893]OXI93589.1 fatty acid desaturase [Burkholderia sp. AU33803]OXI94245.1 fatty acid desaturase [Burkholderia sp. AU33647]POZ81491.1 fatty acid desaturase [Burkholderia contaminans]PRD92175.1 fatty acid desaturase [Burkholderia contaminans]